MSSRKQRNVSDEAKYHMRACIAENRDNNTPEAAVLTGIAFVADYLRMTPVESRLRVLEAFQEECKAFVNERGFYHVTKVID